jgi:hypothetical protein
MEPSFDRFDLQEVTVGRERQDVIWDSGASDNVTGGRCALFDFTLLQKPIAVRVATHGPTNFITGTGTLRFPGMRQTTIVVKNVYFCENARSTLLSIAAFKKSNTHFRVTNNFDTIDLVNSSGKVLIRSSFDPQTNSWPVCKPLRAEKFLSQSTPYCNKLVSPPVEMNSIFKSPNAVESSQFTCNPADMTKDEKTLLFWH